MMSCLTFRPAAEYEDLMLLHKVKLIGEKNQTFKGSLFRSYFYCNDLSRQTLFPKLILSSGATMMTV